MANLILDRLRKKDKKGLFKDSRTSISYKTGFLPFDYMNGYLVQVRGDDESLLGEYASVGLTGGTFLTVVGKTGVAKTTWTIQVAYNMVKNYDNAFVLVYDLEQALNMTRIKAITGASQKELRDKIVLKQAQNYIEDIFDAVMAIAKEKADNPDDYKYKTGLKDEFGDDIVTYVPTVVVIDSLPTLESSSSSSEMEGDMAANRMAKKVTQFYSRLMPVIKEYNITVCAINHIKDKIEINPFSKTQAQVMYLKQNESVPRGHAALYYANNLLKFVSSGKFKEEDDGFDGFEIRVEILKSRTNKSGKACTLIYNQYTGFDPLLTLLRFAEDNDLVEGRNPYRYFKGYKDIKFDSRKFHEEVAKNYKLKEILDTVCIPVLEEYLSTAKPDQSENTDVVDDATAREELEESGILDKILED